MEILINLLIGLILGAISAWLVMKAKIQATHEQAKNRYSTEQIILSEQLRQKEQQLSELKQQLLDTTQQKDSWHDKFSNAYSEISTLKTQVEGKSQKINELQDLLNESNSEIVNQREKLNSAIQQSAKAESQLHQIDTLNTEIGHKQDVILQYQRENTELREKISELSTQLKQTQEYSNNQISQLNGFLENANTKMAQYEQEITTAHQKYSEANAKELQLIDLQQNNKNQLEKIEQLQKDNALQKENYAKLNTELKNERQAAREKLELLEKSHKELTDAFKVISNEALQNNNQQFIELATRTLEHKQEAISNLVSPLNQSLEAFKQQLRKAENARLEDKGQIIEQLQSLATVHSQLQSETANLTKALGQPTVRGMWGEMQLSKVLEIAGMQKPYDFVEQETTNSEERQYRPDVIINLPDRKKIIVDSKAACNAYLEAIQTEDQSRQIEHLRKHAQHIRTHINQLSSKSYWSRFDHTPEFVVMFLPREVFFSAALEHDPGLIEFAMEKKVIIATPTTLISLLKTIEYSWKQEKIALNIEEIRDLGKELHERFTYFTNNLVDIRKHLDKTVKSFNTAVYNFDSQLSITANKFQELGGYEKEIKEVETIEQTTRLLKSELD